MNKLTILAALSLAACTAAKDDSGDTAVEIVDTATEDTGTEPVFAASAELTATGVTVVIENGSGTYDFGIVQSGTADNWTGEDCLNGYALGGGTVSLNCHSVGATGGTITAVSGSDYDFASPDPAETLFTNDVGEPGAADNGEVTYYLANEAGQCWVWGANTAYYAEKGCTTW